MKKEKPDHPDQTKNNKTGPKYGHIGAKPPTGPRYLRPADLVQELIELGVMIRRTNDRLDRPDICRIAFDVGRTPGCGRPEPLMHRVATEKP
jgi:hypothetical protein